MAGGFDHFREFANFLDGVGLPAEWSPYFHGPDPENDLLDPELRDPRPDATDMAAHDGRAGTPFSYWLPSAPEKSKLAEGQPENSKCHFSFLLHVKSCVICFSFTRSSARHTRLDFSNTAAKVFMCSESLSRATGPLGLSSEALLCPTHQHRVFWSVRLVERLLVLIPMFIPKATLCNGTVMLTMLLCPPRIPWRRECVAALQSSRGPT